MYLEHQVHLKHDFVLATTNQAKHDELAFIAQKLSIKIGALPAIVDVKAIQENGMTYEENASIKATYYSRLLPSLLIVAEDSGLEVDALGGLPGIWSARYSDCSTPVSFHDRVRANANKLLTSLEGIPMERRTAKFVCVLSVARKGCVLHDFRGTVNGRILVERRGNSVFGYDPLFLVEDLGRTFAELSMEDKARYGHRGKAFHALASWSTTEQIA